MRHAIKLAIVLLAVSIRAPAADIYVRADGAIPPQCDGTADIAYGASASGHCGISNPMYVLPPDRDGGDGNIKALMQGGDTLHIAAGQYQLGFPLGKTTWNSCNGSYVWDCHMRPVPSGTAAQHTKIIGAGSALTQLWGSGGSSLVLNLTGSSYVDVSGLEITDHSSCIQNHPAASIKCPSGNTGASWAASGIVNTLGAADNAATSNISITDVNVHGMAKYGVQIGHNTNLTITNSKVIANGFGGISLDTGLNSPSSGTNTISYTEIAWNGCTKNYPSTAIYGCWGQQTGGYGDGLGSSSASDQGVWNFSQVSSHDNTQDGIDFLHADPSAVITFDRVNAYRNAGNQLKGNGNVSITNSIVNGYCSAFVGVGDMQGTNSGGGGTSGDICRALGDAVVLGQSAGRTTSIANSTIISEGNCLITVPDSGVGDATSKLNVSNNILIGLPVWVDGNQKPPPQSCLYYWNLASAKPNFSGNVIFGVKGETAPAGNLYQDPKLADERLATFDPTPTSATPPNVGAVRGAVTPPPPPICPAVCVPKLVCTNSTASAATCNAVCQ